MKRGSAGIPTAADDRAAAADSVRDAPLVAIEVADVRGRLGAQRIDERVGGVIIVAHDVVAGNELGIRPAGNVVLGPGRVKIEADADGADAYRISPHDHAGVVDGTDEIAVGAGRRGGHRGGRTAVLNVAAQIAVGGRVLSGQLPAAVDGAGNGVVSDLVGVVAALIRQAVADARLGADVGVRFRSGRCRCRPVFAPLSHRLTCPCR